MKSVQVIINEDFASPPAASAEPILSAGAAARSWRSFRVFSYFLILASTSPAEFLDLLSDFLISILNANCSLDGFQNTQKDCPCLRSLQLKTDHLIYFRGINTEQFIRSLSLM